MQSRDWPSPFGWQGDRAVMMTPVEVNRAPSSGQNAKRLLFACFTVLTVTFAASAHPPEGAEQDSPIAKWFKSLRNNHGLSCCEISDCRPVEARLRNGYYEALIDNRWFRIPDETINNTGNPTGQYIACYSYYDDFSPHLYCFVPIPMGELSFITGDYRVLTHFFDPSDRQVQLLTEVR